MLDKVVFLLDLCTCSQQYNMAYYSGLFFQELGSFEYPCVCVLSRSVMSDFVTPWTVAHQAPLSMGIVQARTLEWVAMPSSRGSFQPGIKPRSLTLQVDSLLS